MGLARLYRPTPRNLRLLARVLRKGEVVAVPTETVYGLAANALDPRACARIFRAKGRPVTDPLIVHIGTRRDLNAIAMTNPVALRLARAFWPGPLTLVLPRRDPIPDIVTSSLPSVAIRLSRHPVLRRLIREAGFPLAAPSANPFGYVSPTTAQHVRAGLGRKIRHILDAGPCQFGVESTIVDLCDPHHPRILRPGAITQQAIAEVVGKRVPLLVRTPTSRSRPRRSPGLFARHYSPHRPLLVHRRFSLKAIRESGPDEAWVFFRKPPQLHGPNVRWLDTRGNARRAARRLYATLLELDGGSYSRIHVELARGSGIADAINDRLYRAAARPGHSSKS